MDYATTSEQTTREFRLDGKVPLPAAKAIHFKRTGGFGTSVLDWKFRSLETLDGEEATVFLKKGTHRIRMTNLKDGLGMDFIVLVRVK